MATPAVRVRQSAPGRSPGLSIDLAAVLIVVLVQLSGLGQFFAGGVGY